ncbi:MAG: hypothetical protein FWH17_11665 [Oscillospiraceae bacterium]|nr:hypothetical protein [Oscillospiraceae bacterium]
MYFKDDKQISLFEFGQSAGLTFDPENRWVKMVHKVDWDKIEDKYCDQLCQNNGAPAKPVRLPSAPCSSKAWRTCQTSGWFCISKKTHI